jgi:HK97 family phage major capsid protein
MPVIGTETKAELRAQCATKSQRAEELLQKINREEATRDEIAEAKDLGEEIKSLEEAIREFPEPEGVREQVTSTKTFLRARATPAPPGAGRTTGGDGNAIKVHGGGGSPQGGHASYVKSLGLAIADELKAAHANRSGVRKGELGNWGVDLPGFERLTGYTYDDGIGEPQPGIVRVERQQLTIADLLGRYTTNGPTVRYVRQNSHTNAAASVAMGGTKPEGTWDLEQIIVQVTKIAVTAKVADEMFEDYGELRTFVDETLRFDVMEREEALILNGNGTPPNMEGILQTDGIQTETAATAADEIPALLRAITKIRAVGRYEPDGLVIHPTDYQNLRLTLDGNDQFYGGGPFTGAYGQTPLPANPGVWGQRTVITTAIPAGTVLVGAFQRGGAFARRSGVRVQATNTNEDDFVNNLMTIRAEERGVVLIYRPSAFCAVSLAA